MKLKFLVLMGLAAGSLLAGPRFFVGFGFGVPAYAPAPVYAYAPPPPVPVVRYAPPCPGPGYGWVAGYYYPRGPRWGWRPGYWARRPYARGYWVAPRYYGHRYYAGYWRR